MMRTIVAAGLLLLAGCATMAQDDTPIPTEAGECRIDDLAPLIGRAATAELGTEALRLSRARTIRWIQPGMAVTMDYRPDRLNIRLDAANRVEAFDCG